MAPKKATKFFWKFPAYGSHTASDPVTLTKEREKKFHFNIYESWSYNNRSVGSILTSDWELWIRKSLSESVLGGEVKGQYNKSCGRGMRMTLEFRELKS